MQIGTASGPELTMLMPGLFLQPCVVAATGSVVVRVASHLAVSCWSHQRLETAGPLAGRLCGEAVANAKRLALAPQ